MYSWGYSKRPRPNRTKAIAGLRLNKLAGVRLYLFVTGRATIIAGTIPFILPFLPAVGTAIIIAIPAH
jgi:hypothetical protein